MTRRRALTPVFLVLTLAFLVLAAGSCGRAAPSAAPASGESASGQPRIVALSPAVAVMLRDLGHEGSVVARHAYDRVLPPSVPVAGDQGGVDYEVVLAVRPTHVVTEFGEQGVPERLGALAREHGWVLMDVRLRSLDEIAGVADDLALLFGGEPPRGAREVDPSAWLSRFDLPSARLAEAWRDRGPAVRGAGRVLLLVDGGEGALGPGSFHHELLVRLGGTPALTEGGPWQTLDAEDVLRLAPDAIIVYVPEDEPGAEAARFVEPPGPDAAEVRRRLGRAADLPIPAVERGRVALIYDRLALMPATSLAQTADQTADALSSFSPELRAPGSGGP